MNKTVTKLAFIHLFLASAVPVPVRAEEAKITRITDHMVQLMNDFPPGMDKVEAVKKWTNLQLGSCSPHGKECIHHFLSDDVSGSISVSWTGDNPDGNLTVFISRGKISAEREKEILSALPSYGDGIKQEFKKSQKKFSIPRPVPNKVTWTVIRDESDSLMMLIRSAGQGYKERGDKIR